MTTRKIDDTDKCPQQSTDSYTDIRGVNPYLALADAYTGRGGFLPEVNRTGGRAARNYLEYSATENFFVDRSKRSVYVNHYKPSIDCKVDPVFSKKAPRVAVMAGETELETHPYLDYSKNVNGLGMNQFYMNQNTIRSALRDEVAFLIMDKDESGETYEYIQPAITVDPYSIETEPNGKLKQIGFLETSKEDDTITIRKLWTAEFLTIQQAKNINYSGLESVTWEFVEETPVQIGYMPVLPVFANPRVDGTDYLPWPQSYGIMLICWKIFNLMSDSDWIIARQAHDIMVIKNAEGIEAVREGVTNAIAVNDPTGNSSGADVTPYSPNPDHVPNHLANIEHYYQELRRVADEHGINTAESSGQAESGIAKAFTFTARNESIKRVESIAKAIDEWRYLTWQEYNGVGSWSAETDYAGDYTPEMNPSLDELQTGAEFFKTNGVEDGFREVAKMVAKKLLGTNKLALDLVIDDIESSEVIDERDPETSTTN